MDRVENLRKSREDYAVKLRDFLRISGLKPNAHIIFFEGQDSKYYSFRIDNLHPDLAWEGINSGGKDNVIKLFNLIVNHNQHKTIKTLFFIDRDFDELEELPNDHRVYITPGYSVENLYVTESAFRRVLKDEFGLSEYSENDNLFEKCINAFRKNLESFLEHSAPLNGWLLLQRKHEKQNPGSSKTNLGSIKLAQVFRVDLSTTSALFTLDDIEQATQATRKFAHAEAMEAIAIFPKEDRIHRFRGKFLAFFLRAFLAKLCDDANSATPTLFSKKHPVALHVSEKNLLSELCQYADTPPCLRTFLANIPVKVAAKAQEAVKSQNREE